MASLTKSQKRLLIIMAVVLVFAVFDFIVNSDDYLSFFSKHKTSTKSKATKTKLAQNNINIKAEQSEKYFHEWGRDPFYDKNFAVPVKIRREISLTLKAISYEGKNSVVMINDKVLMLGDVIEGYQLIKIDPTQVFLRKGETSKILYLK